MTNRDLDEQIRTLAREYGHRIAMYVSGTKWTKTGIRARLKDFAHELAATVEQETREQAARIAEGYLHILPRSGEPYNRLDAQAAYSNSTVKLVAAAIRQQRQEDR